MMGTLSRGRQAQRMPVLGSITDHKVDPIVPYVWSIAFEPGFNSCIRRIDVTVTLVRLAEMDLRGQLEETCTHNMPSAKTPTSAARSLRPRCSFQIEYIGRIRITISPVIFIAALVYQNASRLKHFPLIE